MKESGKYPKFTSWAEGYCALTYTYRDKEMIVNYIKNQKHEAYSNSTRLSDAGNSLQFVCSPSATCCSLLLIILLHIARYLLPVPFIT